MLAEEMIDNTIDQDERLWTRSSCKRNEPEDEEGFSSCRPETLIIYDGALSVDFIDSLSVTQTKIDFSKASKMHQLNRYDERCYDVFLAPWS